MVDSRFSALVGVGILILAGCDWGHSVQFQVRPSSEDQALRPPSNLVRGNMRLETDLRTRSHGSGAAATLARNLAGLRFLSACQASPACDYNVSSENPNEEPH